MDTEGKQRMKPTPTITAVEVNPVADCIAFHIKTEDLKIRYEEIEETEPAIPLNPEPGETIIAFTMRYETAIREIEVARRFGYELERLENESFTCGFVVHAKGKDGKDVARFTVWDRAPKEERGADFRPPRVHDAEEREEAVEEFRRDCREREKSMAEFALEHLGDIIDIGGAEGEILEAVAKWEADTTPGWTERFL